MAPACRRPARRSRVGLALPLACLAWRGGLAAPACPEGLCPASDRPADCRPCGAGGPPAARRLSVWAPGVADVAMFAEEAMSSGNLQTPSVAGGEGKVIVVDSPPPQGRAAPENVLSPAPADPAPLAPENVLSPAPVDPASLAPAPQAASPGGQAAAVGDTAGWKSPQVVQRLPTDGAHLKCPTGQYRTEGIVWQCQQTKNSGTIQMRPGAKHTALTVPVGVKNFGFRAKSSAHQVSATVTDGETDAVALEGGSLPYVTKSYRGATLTYSTFVGDDDAMAGQHVASIWVEGVVRSPLTIAIEVLGGEGSEAQFEVRMEYIYEGIEPCPAQPSGCKPYAPGRGRSAAMRWSCAAREKIGGAAGATDESLWQAWHGLAEEVVADLPDRGRVPWHRHPRSLAAGGRPRHCLPPLRWPMVSSRAGDLEVGREWQLSFHFLDRDGDSSISRAEFTSALALCGPEAEVPAMAVTPVIGVGALAFIASLAVTLLCTRCRAQPAVVEGTESRDLRRNMPERSRDFDTHDFDGRHYDTRDFVGAEKPKVRGRPQPQAPLEYFAHADFRAMNDPSGTFKFSTDAAPDPMGEADSGENSPVVVHVNVNMHSETSPPPSWFEGPPRASEPPRQDRHCGFAHSTWANILGCAGLRSNPHRERLPALPVD